MVADAPQRGRSGRQARSGEEARVHYQHVAGAAEASPPPDLSPPPPHRSSRLARSSGRTAKGARPVFSLQVRTGLLAGRSFDLLEGTAVLVGHSAAAQVRLPEEEGIERAHCLILVEGRRSRLFDLHGKEGTFVDGKRIRRAPLEEGLTFRCGQVRLQVLAPAGAGSEAADAPLADSLRTVAAELPACDRCERVFFERELTAPNTLRAYGGLFCGVCAALIQRRPEELPGYKLLGELGHGAMGSVYKAIDVKRERIVALKVLHAFRMTTPRDLQRFAREVNLCHSLKHPNIVSIYTVAKHADEIYFTMRYVAGETLEKRVRRDGPLAPEAAVSVIRQIASALDEAREKAIVHRDVKPANILIDQDGRAFLTDFGLAKCYAESATAGLTIGQQQVGTPYFMSPEQVEDSKSVDHRSDVFSLGSVGYFALTGRVPFDADNLPECLYKVAHDEPPPLAELNPAVPPGLVSVIERMMAKDLAHRFPSGQEVARALEAVADRL